MRFLVLGVLFVAAIVVGAALYLRGQYLPGVVVALGGAAAVAAVSNRRERA